jgi:hypothetical protein
MSLLRLLWLVLRNCASVWQRDELTIRKIRYENQIPVELTKIYGITASPETIGNCDGCRATPVDSSR